MGVPRGGRRTKGCVWRGRIGEWGGGGKGREDDQGVCVEGKG